MSVICVVDRTQEEFPVWEDFILIEAGSKEELDKKISEHANLINAAGDCRYKEMPAKQIFIGVRKIRSIYNTSFDIDEIPPGDGTELSHCFMVVDCLDSAKRLAEGRAVKVYYVDDDSD